MLGCGHTTSGGSDQVKSSSGRAPLKKPKNTQNLRDSRPRQRNYEDDPGSNNI